MLDGLLHNLHFINNFLPYFFFFFYFFFVTFNFLLLWFCFIIRNLLSHLHKQTHKQILSDFFSAIFLHFPLIFSILISHINLFIYDYYFSFLENLKGPPGLDGMKVTTEWTKSNCLWGKVVNVLYIKCFKGAQGETGSKGERGDPGLPVRIMFYFGLTGVPLR